MVENPEVRQKISLDIKNVEFVKANFISENYVGIDCYAYCNLEPIVDDRNQSIAKTPKKVQQTFLNSYMQSVKRPNPFTEVASNKNKSEIVKNVSNIKSVGDQENEHIHLPEKKKTFHFRSIKEHATNEEKHFENQAKPVDYNFATKYSKFDENPLKTPKKKYFASKVLSNKTGPINNKHDSLLSESFTNAIMDELEADRQAIEAEETTFNGDSGITEIEAHEYNKNAVLVEKDVPIQTIKDGNYRANDGQLATKFEQNKKFTEIQNQEKLSKMNMPESTDDRNKSQSISILSHHPKRAKKLEENASSFDVVPQKNIKWRSPLVNSPAVKHSPNFCDFAKPGAGKEVDLNDFRDGAHNTSMFSMASSFASERVNSSKSGKSAKRKSKFQFPLSDHECPKETNNHSFTKKGNAFDEFVDLEQYGIDNRQKELITQSSHARKYYSQLMNSDQQKPGAKEESSTKIISSTSQSKPTSNTEDFQQSQDLYSDNDFLSQETHQVEKSGADFVPNTQSEYQRKSMNNVPPFTQPIPIEYQHHPATNLNTVSRNNLEYYPQRNPEHYPQRNPELDRLNRSFIEQPNNYPHSDFEEYYQQRPLYDSQRYAPRVCSCFSQQQPCFSVPSPFPHHVCCNHYPRMNHYCKPYPDPIPEVIPYRGYVENRNLHHTRPYTISINDIPDSCIDHFSQQLDEPSFVVNNNPANNFVENVPRYDASGFNRESTSLAYENKENIFNPQSQSYARSYHGFQPEQTPENQLPTQILKENVSKLFATSTRRKLSHHNNREAAQSQSLNLLAQSAQRRSINFNSVEARHNNMIDPRDETFTFSSSRNPNSVQYGSMPSNDNREYLPNRFRLLRK